MIYLRALEKIKWIIDPYGGRLCRSWHNVMFRYVFHLFAFAALILQTGIFDNYEFRKWNSMVVSNRETQNRVRLFTLRTNSYNNEIEFDEL